MRFRELDESYSWVRILLTLSELFEDVFDYVYFSELYRQEQKVGFEPNITGFGNSRLL